MKRPKTVQEYVELVRQAVVEVEDLRACLEYELEELQRFPAFLNPLEEGIKGLYQAMQQGTYQWGRDDLPVMAVVRKHEDEIPFVQLLEVINETHRRGLDVEAADAENAD